MNENDKIELTIGLLNGLLSYLGTRPYGEVATLIQAVQLQAAPQLPVQAPPADTEGQ